MSDMPQRGMHLICGEALYDVFLDGRELDPEDRPEDELPLRAVAGGSPFNVAIGMARLGAEVGFASDLARDFLGERIVAQLAREGVADLFLRRSAPSSALAFVTTDEAGIPSYGFAGLEQAFYCPDDDAVQQADGRIGGIHLGSIATVLPNSARPLIDVARRFADRALISLDPNVRLSIVPAIAAWHQAIEALRPFCQVVKASEEDIAALYGDTDADAICRAWLTGRTALIVLTRGAKGASMFTRAAGRVDIPPAAARVVDTVGAGDSFMAALLFMLTRNGWVSHDVMAALAPKQLLALGSFAALAAGVTCSRRGPVLPTSSELPPLRATSMEARA